MRLVVADTSPINYLIQIGQVEILPRLFERIALPDAVQAELFHPLAPASVCRWIADPPAWLEIHDTTGLARVPGLDAGEAAAIALAEFLQADLLLIDERAGFHVARKQGLHATGTLGILDLAAERHMLDFADAIRALEDTTFRRPVALLNVLLEKHKNRSK